MPLTERSVQLMIVQNLGSGAVVACPNYTPDQWWECDLWAVTRAGYVAEYEIKLTLADFRADSEKSKRVMHETCSHRRKHECLGSKFGPSRFYYVVPKSLRESVLDELPKFAGLGVIRDGSWMIDWVKQAPQLHKAKVDKRELELAKRRMWHRYWNAIRELERLSA